MKLIVIFGICSCGLLQNGVGPQMIITSKFFGVTPVNFLKLYLESY